MIVAKKINKLLGLLVALLLCSFAEAQQIDLSTCPDSDSKKARKACAEASKLMLEKRPKKAEIKRLLTDAIQIDENYARAHYLMADMLIKAKKTKEAEKHLLIVEENCPDLDEVIYFTLGSISFGIKDYAKAKSRLERFIKSNQGTEADRSAAREMISASTFFIEGFGKPVPFDPKPVQHISTEADEYLPMITADNEFAFFTRRTFEKPLGALTEKMIERFTISQRQDDDTFDKGSPLPAPFNKNSNEGGASLTADNKNLYFTICRDEVGELLNCDIWYAYKQNDKWSEIKNLGDKINGKNTWESQPSISSDGRTLYFSSNRPGGYGELDIWKSTKDANGAWSEPENLGPQINTKGSEKSPFFHSDGQTLYFSSTGHMGYGGFDIYFSKLDDNKEWKTPTNIGYPINSEKDDLGFFVSTDGKTGYFASDKLKGNGGWDLYHFPLYKEARPERVLFMRGEVKDENDQIVKDAKLEIKNTRTKETKTIDVDSITGKYVAVVAFNDDQIITVKKEGHAFSSTYLSKEDSSLNKPLTAKMELKPIKVGSNYTINNINFATNSYQLTEQSVNVISEFITFLKENPKVKVAIQGHTDNVGDQTTNLKLSQDRAKSVYEFLVFEDIEQSRLSYKGFGSSQPITSNSNESGRLKNRRTEFKIVEK